MIGSGTLTSLVSATYINLDNTSQSLDFEWDGTGELVLVMDFPESGTFEQLAQIDNVSITAVPEPSTCVIFAGLAALGIIALRRHRRR